MIAENECKDEYMVWKKIVLKIFIFYNSILKNKKMMPGNIEKNKYNSIVLEFQYMPVLLDVCVHTLSSSVADAPHRRRNSTTSV